MEFEESSISQDNDDKDLIDLKSETDIVLCQQLITKTFQDFGEYPWKKIWYRTATYNKDRINVRNFFQIYFERNVWMTVGTIFMWMKQPPQNENIQFELMISNEDDDMYYIPRKYLHTTYHQQQNIFQIDFVANEQMPTRYIDIVSFKTDFNEKELLKTYIFLPQKYGKLFKSPAYIETIQQKKQIEFSDKTIRQLQQELEEQKLLLQIEKAKNERHNDGLKLIQDSVRNEFVGDSLQ